MLKEIGTSPIPLHLLSPSEKAMRIDNEIEYRAAKAVFNKYRFQPNRSKNHPLQDSLQVLATAVKNYEYAKGVSPATARKAA